MDFEAYLISKRIDSARFKSAEPGLWQSWSADFEQMHPNSFTVQKLNLINPIRRRFQLAVAETPRTIVPPAEKSAQLSADENATPVVKPVKPAIPRPMIKPKPKTD